MNDIELLPKIEAAFRVLTYCENIVNGAGGEFGQKTDARALTHMEIRLRDAALSNILEYFNSDAGMTPLTKKTDPDKGDESVPVTK